MKQFTLITLFYVTFLLQACGTMVGFHSKSERAKIDFGPPLDLTVCYFKEKDITEKKFNTLTNAWAKELKLYNINLKTGFVETVPRKTRWPGGILSILRRIPLKKPCDRFLLLKGIRFSDVALEVISIGVFFQLGLKIEVNGAVDGRTHTRGFISARYHRLFQSIFTSPQGLIIHEGYHLLGCGHQMVLTKCYHQIARLKEVARRLPPENDFLPALTPGGLVFRTRKEINTRLGNNPSTPEKKPAPKIVQP